MDENQIRENNQNRLSVGQLKSDKKRLTVQTLSDKRNVKANPPSAKTDLHKNTQLASGKRIGWRKRVKTEPDADEESRDNQASFRNRVEAAIHDSGVLNISPKTVTMRKMKKETVTHNGSCGAGALSIGLCLAICEDRYSPGTDARTKLIESWNTTYPSQRVESFDNLTQTIKDTLEGGNTQDMENLISPVIRVYIGIAMVQQQTVSPEERFTIHSDKSQSWDLDILTDTVRNTVRQHVADAAEVEKNRFYDEINSDVLSYGYYLYDEDLSTIASELFDMQVNRIVSINRRDFNIYQDINNKLKYNHEIICSYALKHDIEIEHCSTYTANPSLIPIKNCNEPLEGYYTVDIMSSGYKVWMKTKGIIKDITVALNLKKVDDMIQFPAGNGVYKQDDTLKKTVEETLYNHVEEKVADQIRSGETRFYIDHESVESNVIDLMHSDEIFWDSLINPEQAAKYSRMYVKQKSEIDDISAYTRLGKKSSIALEKIWNEGMQCCLLMREVFVQFCQAISNRLLPLVKFVPNQINPLDYLFVCTGILLIVCAPSIASFTTASAFCSFRFIMLLTLGTLDQRVELLPRENGQKSAQSLLKAKTNNKYRREPIRTETHSLECDDGGPNHYTLA